MTGSLVSTSKPVAVFTMSTRLMYQVYPQRDIFMEQLPPVESYGHEFIVKQQPFRIRSENFCYFVSLSPFFCEDHVWIVASEMNTVVSVANDSSAAVYDYHLDAAGQTLLLQMVGDIMQISSDRAILVIHVLKPLSENDGAMLVVPPLGQYGTHDVVMFNPHSLSAKQVVVYSADQPAPQMAVDGTTYAFDGQVKGPLFNVSYLVVNYTGGTNASTDFRALTAGVFGGYVSELGGAEAITSLAHGLQQINAVSQPLLNDIKNARKLCLQFRLSPNSVV